MADYVFSDDPTRIDVDIVHQYLAEESYWAKGRTIDVVRKSIRNSHCLAAYTENGEMAAFARVITDWATMYYICDLFVLAGHRRRGLGKELVRRITSHPVLEGLAGMLLTADAHGLYSQYGFEQSEEVSKRFMRRPRDAERRGGTCA